MLDDFQISDEDLRRSYGYRDPYIPRNKDRIHEVSYEEDLDRYIALVAKLNENDISVAIFMRLMVKSFIDGEPRIRDLVDEHITKHHLIGKQKLKKKAMLRAKEDQVRKRFAIGNNKIDFDYDPNK